MRRVLPGTLKLAALALSLIALIAAAARDGSGERAAGNLAIASWGYFPGSILRIAVDGFGPPYSTDVLGGAVAANGELRVPDASAPGSAFVVAGNAAGLASATLHVVAPPDGKRTVIAVASYDEGIALHDARTFAPLGLFATGGTPSDVAVDTRGRIIATDTQGDALTLVAASPWGSQRVANVPLADELAVDGSTIFASNRDAGGTGAVTRVAADGTVERTQTGLTAEGLAVDKRRGIVYVANVNDGTISAIDATTMRERSRFAAVARVFSIALSADGKRLWAVSNQSAGSPFQAPGSVVALALDGGKPHVVARSGPLAFPIGIAADPATNRLFVTDEENDAIDVLDARTLRALVPPLSTCRTPWKPLIDAGRLYIPCARADAIDVIDLHTLKHVRGAPFPTAGYPLAVAIRRA